MTHARLPIPQQRLESYHAFGTLCVLWFARMIALLPARQNRGIHIWIRKLERLVEMFVFLAATRRVSYVSPRNQAYVRRSAPHGFRRMRKRNRLFFKLARVRARGDLNTRIAQLLNVLADPEPYIARFVKRLVRGVRGSRLFAVGPRAELIGVAPSRAVTAANTS